MDEDEVAEEAASFTPPPLNRWTLLAGVLAVSGDAVQHVAAIVDTMGTFVADIGVALAHNWVVQQERLAFQAAALADIEKITTEG